MRAARAALISARETASARAAALAPIDLWPSTPWVGAYLAMPEEIDPAPLVARLARRGVRLALPVVIAPGLPLVFREATGELAPDAAGIPAPPASAREVSPGLIIAPLLGFDAEGRRLGQGGGYYDRTLRELRASGSLLAVGLAFAAQEAPVIPTGRFDERLDAILTETGYRAVSEG